MTTCRRHHSGTTCEGAGHEPTSTNWVSPNEMLDRAKFYMLDNREPTSREDWGRVMNFFAANVQADCADAACRLMAMIYEMPLTDDEVSAIVAFQLARR